MTLMMPVALKWQLYRQFPDGPLDDPQSYFHVLCVLDQNTDEAQLPRIAEGVGTTTLSWAQDNFTELKDAFVYSSWCFHATYNPITHTMLLDEVHNNTSPEDMAPWN